jgi:lysophospholipase L1-like esterase
MESRLERPTFAETCIERGVGTLAVFGDSITVGAGASQPERSWASMLARRLGARLVNKGVSGTVLQATPLRDGRGDSGRARFSRDLLGADKADALAILYGYNDARYTADPRHFNVDAFTRDYRSVLIALLDHFPREAIAIGSPPYPTERGLMHGGPGFTGQNRGGFEAYRDAVRALAIEHVVAYAAVYETMAAAGDGALASEDLTHPSDAGHLVICEAFCRARVPSTHA